MGTGIYTQDIYLCWANHKIILLIIEKIMIAIYCTTSRFDFYKN